jgi:ribosomal protein S27AE
MRGKKMVCENCGAMQTVAADDPQPECEECGSTELSATDDFPAFP